MPVKNPSKTPIPDEPYKNLIILVCISLTGLFIYRGILHAPFVFDDISNIRDNPAIRIPELTPDSLFRAAFDNINRNRPAANFSFAVNAWFCGDSTFGFHLTNVIIHIFSAFFLFLLIRKILELVRQKDAFLQVMGRTSFWIAFFSAFLFLVHPLCTQSVTLIVQRMNSMASLFFVASLFFFIQARTHETQWKIKGYTVLCVLSGILAVFSKENALTLPVFIVICEWIFFRDMRFPGERSFFLICCTGCIVLLGISTLFLFSGDFENTWALSHQQGFTMKERLLTELRVVIYYISLFFCPHPDRLAVDYAYPLSVSLFSPWTTFLSLLAIGFAVYAGITTGRTNRVYLFSMIWFFGNLVMESTILPLALIYEHRTYLPMMMLSFLFVYTGFRCSIFPGKRIFPKKETAIFPAICFFLGICILFSYWTLARNQVWKSNYTLWKDNVEKFPDIARARLNLAVAMGERGMIQEAMKQCRIAIQIDPMFKKAYNNLGNIHAKSGNTPLAVSCFMAAILIDPEYANPYNNLGNVRLLEGRFGDAEYLYKKALSLFPAYPAALENLAKTEKGKKVFLEKERTIRKAIQSAPEDYNIRYQLAKLYESVSQLNKAYAAYETVISLHPEAEVFIRNALARIRLKQNRPEDALSEYQQILALRPKLNIAHYNLACLYSRTNAMEKAMEHLKKAVELGYDDMQKVQTDPDLALLRETDQYRNWEKTISGGLSGPGQNP